MSTQALVLQWQAEQGDMIECKAVSDALEPGRITRRACRERQRTRPHWWRDIEWASNPRKEKVWIVHPTFARCLDCPEFKLQPRPDRGTAKSYTRLCLVRTRQIKMARQTVTELRKPTGRPKPSTWAWREKTSKKGWKIT